MRVVASVIGVLIVMHSASALGQTDECSVQGPPFGPTVYVGDAGYKFDYWSHSGTKNGDNFYQPGIKNLGKTPLTIDWPDAGYFRRGIASGSSAPGTCGRDRNRLNTASGRIKYGPNANFDGPEATFFKSSSQATRSSEPISFLLEWESILDSGEKYLASVSVEAMPSGTNSIRYTFTNKGRPVELEWAGVLSEAALAAAQRQHDGLVQDARLVLRKWEPVGFTLYGVGQRATITAPLSVFTPDGLLLYRDRHRGLAFISAVVAR